MVGKLVQNIAKRPKFYTKICDLFFFGPILDNKTHMSVKVPEGPFVKF